MRDLNLGFFWGGADFYWSIVDLRSCENSGFLGQIFYKFSSLIQYCSLTCMAFFKKSLFAHTSVPNDYSFSTA